MRKVINGAYQKFYCIYRRRKRGNCAQSGECWLSAAISLHFIYYFFFAVSVRVKMKCLTDENKATRRLNQRNKK